MSSSVADLPTFPVPRRDPFDLPAEYARLREESPISRVRLWDGSECWLVTGHELAREVLGSRRFSSDAMRPGFPQPSPRRRSDVLGRTLVRMDPPEHTRYRRLLNPDFVIRRVEEMRPEIERIAGRLLDDMVRRTPPVDLVRAFALPLPSLVICELLGVPEDDRKEFEDVSRTLVASDSAPEQALAAIERLRAYMEGLVEAKRSRPDGGLLSRLVGLAEAGELARDEVVGTARLLLLAGHVTTANMITLGVLLLLRHPEQLAELRRDPGLLESAVEELLRHQTLIQGGLSRVATEDVELGGQRVSAGEGVIVLIAAANRDPGLGGGDRFDIHRGDRRHLAFGYGFHQCLGQLLARLELQVALGTIAARLPTLRLAVPLDEVPFRPDGFLLGAHRLPVAW
jgi:cytochrome P450